MRTHESRYQKDQDKLDLAINMIQLNARTCFIREWTGLSDDRIRKLVKFYGVKLGTRLLRHRGRSPSLSPLTSRNIDTRQQAHLLGGLFATSGLMSDAQRPPLRQGLTFGQEFCRAYLWYLKLEGQPKISFEHAFVLWQQLAKHTEVALKSCPHCKALHISERYKFTEKICDHCAVLIAPRKLQS